MKETYFTVPSGADLSMSVSYEFDKKGNLNFSWNDVDTARHYGIAVLAVIFRRNDSFPIFVQEGH